MTRRSFGRSFRRNIDNNAYDFIRPIAEGSYGDVYECVHRVSGQLVAIKRFKQAHEDPQVWSLAMRELSVLRNLPSHPNLVQLRRAVCSQSSGRLFFVFELMERSLLQELKRQPGGFIPSSSLKQVAWQLLQALAHCHQQRVIHRDIKPANVLLSGGGATDVKVRNPGGLTSDDGGGGDGGGPSGPPRLQVKLCDFGFARWVPAWDDGQADGSGAAVMAARHPAVSGGPYGDRPRAMSTYVTTRWYRAPEILVSGPYDTGVDVWSYGCTLAELATGRPLFPGSSSADQLWRIMRCLGPLPTALAARVWRNDRLAAVAAPPERGRTLAQRLKGVAPPLVQLITACLTLDPSRRPSAKDLLWLPYFWDVQRLKSAVAAGAAASSSPPAAPVARAARAAGPPPAAAAAGEEGSAPEEALAVPNRRIEPQAPPSSAAAMPIAISASAGTGGSIIISGSGGAVSGSDASVQPLPRFTTDSSLASVAAADGQMRCPWGSSQGMASRASTSWAEAAEAEAAEVAQLEQDRGSLTSMTPTLTSAGHHAATGEGVKGVTPNAASCRTGGLLVRAMSSRADGGGSAGMGGRGYRQQRANTLLGAIDASRLLAVVAVSGLGVHRRFRSGPLSPKPGAAGINGLRGRSGSSSRTGLLRFFQHQQQNHKQHGQSQQQRPPTQQGQERQPGGTLLLLQRQQRPPPRLQQLALAAQSEGRGSSSDAMQSAIGAFLEESVSHDSGGRLAAASAALASAPLLRVSAPQQVAAPRVPPPRASKEPMSRLTYSGCKAYSAQQQQLEHTWTRAASAVAATMASGTKPTCNHAGLISSVSTATLRTSQQQLSVINSPAGMTSAVHFRSSMDVARCPRAPPSPPLRRRTPAAFLEPPSFVPAGASHRAAVPAASAGLLLFTTTSLLSTTGGGELMMTSSEMEFLSSSAAGMATGPPGHEAPLGRAMSSAGVGASRTAAQQRRQGGGTSSPPLPPTTASAAAAAAAVARTSSARESRRYGATELAPAAVRTASSSSSQRLCEPPVTVRCIMSNPASATSTAHEALIRAPYGSLHPYNAVAPVPRVGLESVPATAGRLLAAAVSAATAGGPPPVPATNPRRASSFDRGKSRLIVRSSGDTIACRPSGVSLGGDKVKGPEAAVVRAIAARERQSSGGCEGSDGGSRERGCGSAGSSCGSGKKRGKVAGRLSRALQALKRSYRALKAKALNGL